MKILPVIPAILLIVLLTILLSGCISIDDGNSIALSKGSAGFLGSLLGGELDYCKISSTDPEHVFTESELEELFAFCPGSRSEMIEEILGQ